MKNSSEEVSVGESEEAWMEGKRQARVLGSWFGQQGGQQGSSLKRAVLEDKWVAGQSRQAGE